MTLELDLVHHEATTLVEEEADIDDVVEMCMHEVDEGDLTSLKLLLQEVLIFGFRGDWNEFAAAMAAEVELCCQRCGMILPYDRIKDELELWARDIVQQEIRVH